jgi:hypothetical protein
MYEEWKEVTGNLTPGVQRVFREAISAAQEGKTHLIYNADYDHGFPCLVNTVGSMLSVGGGEGIPSAHFNDVVAVYDRINYELQRIGVNKEPGLVSPLAADILLKHYADLKPEDNVESIEQVYLRTKYVEPTDAEMA